MKKSSALIFSVLFAVLGCQQQSGAADDDSDAPSASSASTAASADTGNIIAVVNGVNITESRMAMYAQGTPITEQNRSVILDNVITSELISQAARNSGIAERDDVRQELAIAEQTVLGRAYVTDFFENNPIGEDKIQALYDKIVEEAQNEQEYNVAHILVDDETLAKDLLAQIKQDPAQFGPLAGQHSKDPGSGANNGELGWMSPATLVPEFAEAMTALGDSGLTDAPIKTTFGWHIIRVDERRPVQVAPLTPQLGERLVQGERADLFTRHIEELREKATVELR